MSSPRYDKFPNKIGALDSNGLANSVVADPALTGYRCRRTFGRLLGPLNSDVGQTR